MPDLGHRKPPQSAEETRQDSDQGHQGVKQLGTGAKNAAVFIRSVASISRMKRIERSEMPTWRTHGNAIRIWISRESVLRETRRPTAWIAIATIRPNPNRSHVLCPDQSPGYGGLVGREIGFFFRSSSSH